MPSSSGRQENMILSQIKDLERINKEESKLKLLTFDNIYEAEKTGITEIEHGHRLWKHERCPDIFRRLLSKKREEEPVAAWFDLTGGLLNQRLLDIKECVASMFDHGSLLFITLAIDNLRGLSDEHYVAHFYRSFDKRISRAFVTDLLLTETISKTKNKYITECMPPYVYKRRSVTYGVFGYIVGKM